MPRPLRLACDLSSKPLYNSSTRALLEEVCVSPDKAEFGDILSLEQVFVCDGTKTGHGWMGLACESVVVETATGGKYLKHYPELRSRLAAVISEIQCDDNLAWAVEVSGADLLRPDIPFFYLKVMIFPDALILVQDASQRSRDGQFDDRGMARLDMFPNQAGVLVLEKPETVAAQEIAQARVDVLLPLYRKELRLPYTEEPECYVHWPFREAPNSSL